MRRNMKKSVVILVATLTTGIATTLPIAPLAAEPNNSEATPALLGRYVIVPGGAGAQERQKAIDKATEEFFFAIRPIVRAKLEKVTRVVNWVDVQVDNAVTVVQFEGRAPIRAVKDGPSGTWKDPEGKEYKVRHFTKGGTFTQTITGEEGERINTFKVDTNGDLVLGIEIKSERLTNPMRYNLRYKKP